MDIYWIYDIPSWQLAIGIVLIYLVLALIGLFLSRSWIYNRFRLTIESNEMVNGIFSGIGMLYGLLLGLVAVAGWQNYDDVEELVSKEAACVVSLYRDVSVLSEPFKGRLQGELKRYLKDVVEVAWPAHRRGMLDGGGSLILSDFHAILAGYKPGNLADLALYQESLSAFNKLSEARRLRLDEVQEGIPSVIWVVILAGALLTLPLIYCFHTPSLMSHVVLTSLFAMFMGFMLFLLAAIDNPLRGEVSISAEPFQSALEGLKSLDPSPKGI